MTNLAELQDAIAQLPESDIRELAAWLQQYLADDAWDQQMKADFASGKLDHFIAQVEADIVANQVRDLDDILHNT